MLNITSASAQAAIRQRLAVDSVAAMMIIHDKIDRQNVEPQNNINSLREKLDYLEYQVASNEQVLACVNEIKNILSSESSKNSNQEERDRIIQLMRLPEDGASRKSNRILWAIYSSRYQIKRINTYRVGCEVNLLLLRSPL